MTKLRSEEGLDVTSAFQGFSAPLHELLDDIHRRGWTVAKIHVKNDQYVAEAKNPHGEKLVANGVTDATAAGNLLMKIMRREHMRSQSARQKLGAWNTLGLENRWGEIAQAYAGAPVYEPKAAVAWMDLAQDCQRRAQMIRAQINVEYTPDPVPYMTMNELREDITKKRHILVSRAFAHHPVWSEQQMLDYRLVVDVLGHAVGGGDWGWHGTCMAFGALAPMLAEQPQKALFTELLGQAAFGSFYRQWGAQKVCFLEEIIGKEQAKENKPGHTGVHPSQSIVPSVLPRIGSGANAPMTDARTHLDPNDGWDSGVHPLQDNAYLWQRVNGIDPLDSANVMESLRAVEPGLTNMHPALGRQAVINSLRSSLLGSRNNDMGHAIHYQDLAHLPADVDDPMAFADALDQRREAWNTTRGYAPGSHKQHWPEEQQFKQWVKSANPQLDDGDVNRLAKRELLHMLSEEEEKIIASDAAEGFSAEQIEHEAYEGMRRRLKALTKPTVDQKVDFGDDHLWHESTHHADMYPPYLASRMRSLAMLGRHAGELAQSARDDLLANRGHGHKFRAKALSLGIPGLGPRQVSNAWLHLAPQTSQLAVVSPEIADILGRDYAKDNTNRDYFRHERELAAGRDAAGYSHMPLGAFSTGLRDLYAGGEGFHPDRTAFKAHAPTPWSSIDWNSQNTGEGQWPKPYWWESTQEARDQAAQDFDRNIAVTTPKDEVPFQGAQPGSDPPPVRGTSGTGRVASVDGRSPWVTHPATAQRLTGVPGTSLMQHIKQTFNHPDCQSVWGQDYECGKA